MSISLQAIDFSLKKLRLFSTYSSSSSLAAEKYLTHLQQNHHQQLKNVEKSLSTVKAKLDSVCIAQVLKKCGEPKLGLRFFIWAALHQPNNYRHTWYMYSKACHFLEINKNPQVIVCVVDQYRDEEDLVVGIKMFKVILNLCRAAKDATLGLWVLRRMKEFNCRPDTVSYNVVIRLVVEKGEVDEAMGLMGEMGLIDLYPDMVTYVSIMKGLCDAGRVEDACGLIKVMKGHGCVPNTVVYSTLLDGICMQGTLEKALEFLGELEKENELSRPNVVTYTTMIKGFVRKGRAIEAVRVLDRMGGSGIKPNRVTVASLLDGLCKQGHVEEACEVIEKVSGGRLQYSELYSLLVVSLLQASKYEESEKIFRMMVAQGMRPNGLASSRIIERFVLERRSLDGFYLLDSLKKCGNLAAVDSNIYSILLAELCRENHFPEAAKLLNVMVEGRIAVKIPQADNIVKHLIVSGEGDLASDVSRIINHQTSTL